MAVNPEELLAHADFVRLLARSLVREEHHVADIVQDTWVAALEHPPASSSSLRSWLSKVLRNVRRKLFRSEVRRWKRESAAALPDHAPSTEEVVAREETRERVVRAVLGLEEPYRSLILLRYYDNLPPRVVAETLGIPLETVKTRLHRGLMKLRDKLKGIFGEDGNRWIIALGPLSGLRFTTLSKSATAGSGATAAGALSVSAKIKIGAVALLLFGATVTFCVLFGQDRESNDPDHAGMAIKSQQGRIAPPGDPIDAAVVVAGAAARKPLLATVQVSAQLIDARCKRSVAGATVLLSMKEEPKRVQEATTDESGRFAFGGIEEPGPAWLAIRGPGYYPRIIDIDDAGGTVEVFDELLLEPRWCVEGRVLGPGGSPFEGARVTSLFNHRFPKVDDQRRLIRDERVTTSGTDGSFLFCSGDDRSERYNSGPGLYRAETEGLVSTWTSRNRKETLILHLEAARDLRGEVVWSRGGAPVEGATVRCCDERDPDLARLDLTHVGPDGSFRFAGVPDRDLDVGVYVQSPTDTRKPSECRVTASRGRTDLGSLVVNGPASLQVWVHDEKSGEAIEGATIGYGDSGFTLRASVTDRSGLARIDDLPSEARIFLSCSLPRESKSQSYMRHKKTPVSIMNTGAPGSTVTASLTVSTEPFWEADPEAPPEKPVSGIVRDRAGNPIPGARIEFFIDGSPEPPDPDPIMRNRKLYLSNDYRGGSHPNFQADQAGRFAFSIQCVPGIHTIRNVTITHPRYVPVWLPGAALDLEVLEDLSFVLDPVTEWLNGEVCAESGDKVPRSNVRCDYTVAESGNEKVQFSYFPATEDEGRFHVAYVPDMILTCTSAPKGFEAGSVRGKSNGFRYLEGSGIRIVVKKQPPPPEESPPPRYPIAVRCVSSEGRPMSGIEVTAWARDGESLWRGVNSGSGWFTSFTGPDGRASVETDRKDLIPVRWCLFRKSLLTSWSILIFEDSRNMQQGPEEKPVTLPAGQVLELLVVYHGISDAVAECIDLLPTRSELKLVPEGGGAAVDLEVEELEENHRIWFNNHQELRYGGHRALAVRRLVPKGSSRLTVDIPGYVPYQSPILTFDDTDEILSLTVDIELQNE